MKNFIKNFIRESNGSWKCISSAEIITKLGRIRVTAGTRFMPGTDMVHLLEPERERRSGGQESSTSHITDRIAVEDEQGNHYTVLKLGLTHYTLADGSPCDQVSDTRFQIVQNGQILTAL